MSTRVYINAHIPNAARPTKNALRHDADMGALHDTEFVSDDTFHDDGKRFTIREAIDKYGPHIGVEVNHGGRFVAMIEADKHPSGVVGVTVK